MHTMYTTKVNWIWYFQMFFSVCRHYHANIYFITSIYEGKNCWRPLFSINTMLNRFNITCTVILLEFYSFRWHVLPSCLISLSVCDVNLFTPVRLSSLDTYSSPSIPGRVLHFLPVHSQPPSEACFLLWLYRASVSWATASAFYRQIINNLIN